MFEAMMKNGAYRVDYLNHANRGLPGSLGFYILGSLPEADSYSHNAKHSLFSGLTLIREQLGTHCLVAIYLDVNTGDNLLRPAYQQMKQDMRAGMFHRLFVLEPAELIGSMELLADWAKFTMQVKYCEVLSIVDGIIQTIYLASDDKEWNLQCSQQ